MSAPGKMWKISACMFIAAAVLGGCEKMNVKKEKGIPISLFDKPSAKEQVDMAFDPDDADRRRKGIILLSDNDWGLQEPYLEGYATVLRTDNNKFVRCAAVRALGRAGPAAKKYLEDVVNALADEAECVRADAAEALSRVRGEEAIGPLCLHATNDNSTDVRIACARTLRHYRHEQAVKTLISCLRDPAFGVRYKAHESLVEMAGWDVGWDPEDWSTATSGGLPEDKPETDKPWWDWMGVTEEEEKAPPEKETPAEKPAPQTQPAGSGDPSEEPAGKRPWWDWMGVTEEKKNK